MSEDRTTPERVAGVPVRAVVVRDLDEPSRWAYGHDVIRVGTAEDNDLVLEDPTVSRFHAEVSRHGDRFRVRDRSSTNGTTIGPVWLRDAEVEVVPGTTMVLGRCRLVLEDGPVESRVLGPEALGALRARSAPMRALLAELPRLAQTDSTVLLLGESGTGKELLARSLHDLSSRRDRPMVTVDCGAVTPTLLASELFGHERGAFTGADRRHVGAFERASGGTLFLDEIGELDAASQAALLGALERRRIRRVGGRDELQVDVRVLAATNVDLYRKVNEGAFRLDLYYRLAVLVVRIPPLRERREDIPLLVEHFLRDVGVEGGLEQHVDREALRRLCERSWQGNVRELRNVVEALIATGRIPDPPSVERASGGEAPTATRPYREARARVVEAFERTYLTALLERTQGNVRAAAREARMDRSHLIDLLARHRIDR
jgi:DNA-binding NtrC family response regulator